MLFRSSQNWTTAWAALAFGINISGMKREEVMALVHQKIRLPERFAEVFEKLRGEGNIFIYAAKIHGLGDEEKTQVLGTLATYLQEVVDGTFYDRRYDLSPQLQKMKELYCSEHGEESWKALMDRWRRGTRVEEIQGAGLRDQAIDVRSFFQTKMNDGHFPKEKMPLLCSVLSGQQVSAEVKRIIENKREGNREALFDAVCANLVLQGRPTPQLIQDALDLAPADWELHNDLQGLLQQFKASSGDFSGYTVENTDNHWDLFLCGTEVVGSCQRVDGDPQLNKNLLGYVVDGKVRMIAVKERSGKIAARSIIKLLWDAEQRKPVLFMERVYSNNTKLNGAVEQMAKKEAERLGIDLVTDETAQGRKFQSYVNRSGFEYEDGGGAIQAMGEGLRLRGEH